MPLDWSIRMRYYIMLTYNAQSHMKCHSHHTGNLTISTCQNHFVKMHEDAAQFRPFQTCSPLFVWVLFCLKFRYNVALKLQWSTLVKKNSRGCSGSFLSTIFVFFLFFLFSSLFLSFSTTFSSHSFSIFPSLSLSFF